LAPIVHIVDDDPLIRASTSYFLSGEGYATEIYADGREFLAQSKPRDGCILLDLAIAQGWLHIA
jgi:two-component system, LuxR family, response regulator FixJ